MHTVPLQVYRPTPNCAADFAAPPYDVFSRKSAAAYVAAHPKSFLAIDRAETSFEPGHDLYAPEVYARARELLNARIDDGTLLRDECACYYIWRMRTADHEQTGIVCGVAVDDYESGLVHRHEETRAEKERDRINHISTTNAQSGPVLLTYRDVPVIDTSVSMMTRAEALYDFRDNTGCNHTIWRIARKTATDSLTLMLEQVESAYIADGHHRAAAAAAVRDLRARANNGNAGEANYFLACLFPDNQLNVLPYDRIVADTDGRTSEYIIAALRQEGFEVVSAQGPIEPQRRGEFGLYTGGLWYHLRPRDTLATKLAAQARVDPVAELDVSVCQNLILGPVLGITDPVNDPRLSYAGGMRACERAYRAAGNTGVAITLHATTIKELMDVADAGRLMPPKSSWFEPKLACGLFIHHL